MRILFDQGVPAPLRHSLGEHEVSTAFEMGWATYSNGQLLKQAEEQFDVLVTTDRHLRTQQNLAGRRVAVLVLPTTSWPRLEPEVATIANAISEIRPGQYIELQLRHSP